jgi:hypothetical protein
MEETEFADARDDLLHLENDDDVGPRQSNGGEEEEGGDAEGNEVSPDHIILPHFDREAM